MIDTKELETQIEEIDQMIESERKTLKTSQDLRSTAVNLWAETEDRLRRLCAWRNKLAAEKFRIETANKAEERSEA